MADELSASDAALIQGGSNLLSQAANAYVGVRMKKKDRQFAEKMYDRQMADALANWNRQNEYNMKMWSMQNDYNSPTSQMARLKEAGLNPNMVYGASAPANASSQPESSSFSQPSVMNMGDTPAPRIDLGQVAGSVMSTYYDLQMKQAQIDNLKADNTIKQNQAALMWTQNLFTDTRNRREALGLNYDQFRYDLDRTYSAEERKERLRQLGRDIDLKDLAIEFNRGSLNDRLQSIKLGNTLRENQDKIQQYEMALNTLGYRPGDAWYGRLLGQFVKNLTGMNIQDMTPENIENKIRQKFNLKK